MRRVRCRDLICGHGSIDWWLGNGQLTSDTAGGYLLRGVGGSVWPLGMPLGM